MEIRYTFSSAIDLRICLSVGIDIKLLGNNGKVNRSKVVMTLQQQSKEVFDLILNRVYKAAFKKKNKASSAMYRHLNKGLVRLPVTIIIPDNESPDGSKTISLGLIRNCIPQMSGKLSRPEMIIFTPLLKGKVFLDIRTLYSHLQLNPVEGFKLLGVLRDFVGPRKCIGYFDGVNTVWAHRVKIEDKSLIISQLVRAPGLRRLNTLNADVD